MTAEAGENASGVEIFVAKSVLDRFSSNCVSEGFEFNSHTAARLELEFCVRVNPEGTAARVTVVIIVVYALKKPCPFSALTRK